MLHSSFRYEHIENGMLKRIDCLLKYQFGNAGAPILYFNTLRRNGRRYLYSNEFISAERETATVLRSLIGNHARWKNEVPGLWLAPKWNRTYVYIRMYFICA